jgi:hypothetical protein
MVVKLPVPVLTQMLMLKPSVWKPPLQPAVLQVSLSPILWEPVCWRQEQASLPVRQEQSPVDQLPAVHRTEGTAE